MKTHKFTHSSNDKDSFGLCGRVLHEDGHGSIYWQDVDCKNCLKCNDR